LEYGVWKPAEIVKVAGNQVCVRPSTSFETSLFDETLFLDRPSHVARLRLLGSGLQVERKELGPEDDYFQHVFILIFIYLINFFYFILFFCFHTYAVIFILIFRRTRASESVEPRTRYAHAPY
jgi:hypothetical protein